jgi:hypothetical protein
MRALLTVTAAVRVIRVDLDPTPAGHFAFGRRLGEEARDLVAAAWGSDSELAALEDWVRSNATGRRIFERFANDSNAAFPLYSEEIRGLAEGLAQPLDRVLTSNLREELLQFLPTPKRLGKCTTSWVADASSGLAGWGHNDDWGQDWRAYSYFVVATVRGGVSFTSWMYPGLLPGCDFSFNAEGVAFTVNSLFPTDFRDHGVGTAWVSRHVVEATSVEDALARASDQRVSTALSYNLASTLTKKMLNAEVTTGGVKSVRHIDAPAFHGNEFEQLAVSSAHDTSTAHRRARWEQLRPATMADLHAYLADDADPAWPVWRNGTAPDPCWTEVTGVFDLSAGSLTIWTGRFQPEDALVFHLPSAEVLV